MHDWQPPWPPIRISDCEWIILRNHWVHPAAVVRRFDSDDDHPVYFRVVTWSPKSRDRKLIGRYLSFEAADRAVRFTLLPDRGPSAPDAMWQTHLQTVEGWRGE
jgi:hypothetical protein